MEENPNKYLGMVLAFFGAGGLLLSIASALAAAYLLLTKGYGEPSISIIVLFFLTVCSVTTLSFGVLLYKHGEIK